MRACSLRSVLVLSLSVAAWSISARAADEAAPPAKLRPVALRFHLGAGMPPDGTTADGTQVVTPQTIYERGRAYGYLPGLAPSADKPTVFAVEVPEGNYDVTLHFGTAERATETTVKAEARRLMLERVAVQAGQTTTRTFTVNVRRPAIRDGAAVALNRREQGPPVSPGWDELLTLEFNGSAPGVTAVEIRSAPDALTVYLAGDSTVTDQVKEPYAGWGQMLPRFFARGVAIANHAESGLALSSFERQQRLQKILSVLKPGDYLFIQFGHNDQKDKSPKAGPFTSYKTQLKKFVAATRERRGLPVLVTPMERRRFDGDGRPVTTLADYAAAVREVGAEEDVPVIDLHARSLQLYAALGSERSTQAFAFYPAGTFPGQTEELKDNTHHNAYGGYELARCVVAGIKTAKLDLARFLTEDAGDFDPSVPDARERLTLPISPSAGPTEKPAGD